MPAVVHIVAHELNFRHAVHWGLSEAATSSDSTMRTAESLESLVGKLL